MRDEEYLFYSDINEKKRTGRSASKRNRTGKGAVRLPSDYMTAKEKRAMNGEVKTYNLDRPMSLKTFRRMPEDLQREYINRLREHFGATSPMIADALGCGTTTVHVIRRDLKIQEGRGGVHKPDMAGFRAWMGEVECEEPVKPEAVKHEVLTAEIAAITTPDELAVMLKMLFGAAPRKYHVVSVE